MPDRPTPRSVAVDPAVRSTDPESRPSANARPKPDPALRLLELGLAVFVVAAPLPFGAVPASGRLGLEVGALILLAIWTLRAWFVSTPLPSRSICIGGLGLMALATLQLVPLGDSATGRLAPAALEVRTDSHPTAEILASEEQMLGVHPDTLEPPGTLSVDPVASASALRTGAALCGLFLVAMTVARGCGVRRLSTALVIGVGLQGLYGLLMLASDDPHLWHLPKRYYLDSATGTFVNRNHFACYIAMGAACGAALLMDSFRRGAGESWRQRFVRLFGGENARIMLLGVLWLLAVAGLLASLSRAGIVLGLAALATTAYATARRGQVTRRMAVALLLVGIAAVPLMQLGADGLVQRFGSSAGDLAQGGGRTTVWTDTLRIAGAFPLAGSGFGTFASVYPGFRSPEVRFYYAHAHNDFVQALAESGLIGAALLLTLLIAMGRDVVRALSGAKGRLAVGLAAGLAAFLLHGLIDFNTHIPANAAIAVVLAGCLEGLPWRQASR